MLTKQEMEEIHDRVLNTMNVSMSSLCTPTRYTITDRGIDVNEFGFDAALNMHASEPDAIPAPDIFYKENVLEPANS